MHAKIGGKAAVAAYCVVQGIENPLEAPRLERDLMDQVELQHSLEGRRLLREHLIRERDPALIAQFKKLLSSFSCCICHFNFEDRYGSIGHGLIEAHHLEPVGLRKDGSPTSGDLIPVCSNWHSMIHTRTPPYTPEEINKLMSEARAAAGR
jgi:5-methylcytosine-specific restriction protein A